MGNCSNKVPRFCKRLQRPKHNLGGYSGEVPPLPIPNREVKLTNADGTAYLGGRVGSRLFKRRSNIVSIFSFLFAEFSAAPYSNGDLAVRLVLSKSPFFITALHKFSANRKIERSKFDHLLMSGYLNFNLRKWDYKSWRLGWLYFLYKTLEY